MKLFTRFLAYTNDDKKDPELWYFDYWLQDTCVLPFYFYDSSHNKSSRRENFYATKQNSPSFYFLQNLS